MEGEYKMSSLIFTILGLLVGILLIGTGVYYLGKERDKSSVKIYGTFIVVGAVMTIGIIIKIITTGF